MMADARRLGLGNQLDIEQILLEAQNRWLRPAEICEILKNYKNFKISAEPPTTPPSGSLFLFDRKVLRYFRKDGHNWRKKKDGKTIKEAHEKLKVGSVDVLHCYYAHGEDNEHFQRRSYWMLEDELSNIVFVHYLEVKQGNRANYSRGKETEATTPYSQVTGESVPYSETESSITSRFHSNNGPVRSHTTDITSPNTVQVSEYEDAESVYVPQATSGFHSFHELRQPTLEKFGAGTSDPYVPQPYTNSFQGKLSAVPGMDLTSIQAAKDKYESEKHPYSASWEDIFENCTPGLEPTQYSALGPSTQFNPMGQLLGDYLPKKQVSDVDSSHLSELPMDSKSHSNSANYQNDRFHEQEINYHNLLNSVDPWQKQPDLQIDISMNNNSQTWLPNGEHNNVLPPNSAGYSDGKSIYSATIRQRLLDGSSTEDGLKKLDSFTRWMSKELEDVTDVDESRVQSSSGADWETVENGNMIDVSSNPSEGKTDTLLGPSLSQDQLFSIFDFAPNWAYVGSETEVLITGRFLRSLDLILNFKWSCMFGEVEVPAELVADGVFCCQVPKHEAGWVPFYVTCSNRVACSEVREFEYRITHSDEMNTADDYSGSSENLLSRFVDLLDLSSSLNAGFGTSRSNEISELSYKINSLLMEGTLEWDEMLKLSAEEEIPPEKLKEELNQKLFKEKLRMWLLQKVDEDGKGPSVLDEGGQGVLHLAAALGFDWAFEPTVLAGVNINFRDVNGWTALHWAASCGRERAVASLLSLGADPGAVTDPSPKHPSGRTPSDLASASGHKGIAGFLGEASLSTVLGRLTLENQGVAAGANAANELSERSPSPATSSFGNTSDGLSVEDTLAVVRNATQAFSRIYQAYRVQSFRKKQLEEYGNDKLGMSDEQALSLVAFKPQKTGQKDEPVHAAATRIQNKFRSYKGRKQYLIIREKIVKIQAHVRGHQVRKSYKKIVWTVGILEKVILRWRRKGSGLRGFKPEALPEAPNTVETTSKEDDDDFLKQGKKQAEEKMQKALSRVKSMVQYQEGRDQYRRLLNVVTEIQAKKVSSPSPSNFDEDLIDIDALLEDDTFMSTVL